MLTAEQIDKVKELAKDLYTQELQDKAIKKHIAILKERKLHWFPKRIVFQWPFRLEEWIKASNGCCKTF